jgi:putative ABC transport system permease protein
MRSIGLLLRWSWRDLRANWVKVLAIALVIAIGTGAYAGLSSNARWRRASYDASYAALAMYDLRVTLPAGASLPVGTLQAAVLDASEAVSAVSERLVLPIQVAVEAPGGEVMVRGEMTGAVFTGDGPTVNRYHAFTGRLLVGSDAAEARVMLERLFATFHDLPPTGSIEVSGGRTLEYVGQATTPEYFAVSPEGEIFLSEASFAGVFTTLETAQWLSGRDGMVNDAVLVLVAGADRDAVEAAVGAAVAPLGGEVETRDENTAYRTLTTDVENDQRIFNALAFLLFAGAVVAAYIMLHRLTQQQRREFGVAMALGVPRWKIAIRPLLVSAQIALLGVVFGVGVGLLIGELMQGVLEAFIPLPIWDTSFQTGLFAAVAVVGFLVPFLATAVPVLQAVRVRPIEAIRPLYHKAVPAGRRSRRSHRHGSTFFRMPFHNLRRSPWRSGFTTVAIALAVTVLVAFMGLIDSIFGTVDTAEREALGGTPDRLVVSLTGFHPTASAEVAAVTGAPGVGRAEAGVRIGGTVSSAGESFPVLIEFVDLDDGVWHPTLVAGDGGDEPGVVLAVKAADDLGVAPGDPVALRHPVLGAGGDFAFTETVLPVIGIHPYPIRSFVYVDAVHAGLAGMDGVANLVRLVPGPGAEPIEVQRALFAVPAVASVQEVAASTQNLRDQMEAFTAIMQAVVVPVIVLAVLIAFLTASISLDARAREHATMFAFGVRVRTALAMATTENLVIGVAATVLGLLGGRAALQWINDALLTSTIPEVGIEVTMRPSTLVTVVVLGVVAVAIAPLFTVRRMRRMDLPGTLRLVE